MTIILVSSTFLIELVKLSEALGLLLPGSRYHGLLSTLPPPEPTAPTTTTTYVVQSAIHNSFPILEELVAIEEAKEQAFIKRELEKRRTRLGAPPLPILKAEVEREAWLTSNVSTPLGLLFMSPDTL